MNSKISENIEYLQYKDKYLSSELRSSRVSVSSNRSRRSNHSQKSSSNLGQNLKPSNSSQARSYLPY